MAFIGDECVYIGSPDWYIGDPLAFFPNAEITPAVLQYALNQTARVDAASSYTDDPLGDVFYYEWEIIDRPQGSGDRLRFEDVNEEVALLALDTVGVYNIGVTVKAANGGCSAQGISTLVCQPSVIANTEGRALPTEWLWSFLPDFWGLMSEADRARVETLWRGIHQLVGSDIMHALNVRDASSIATIQERVLRRWVMVDLALTCENARIYVSPTTTHNIKLSTLKYDTATRRVTNAGIVVVQPPTTTLTSASVVGNGRVVLLGPYDAQPSDINSVIKIASTSYKVIDTVPYGDRVGLYIDNAANVAQNLSVELTRDGASDAGIIYDANLHVAARISSNGGVNGWLSYIAQTEWTRGTQLYVEDAEFNGVSVNDLLELRVQRADILENRYTDIQLRVVGVSGSYVAVDLPDDVELGDLLRSVVGVLESAGGDAVAREAGVAKWVTAINTSILQPTWRSRFLNTWVSGNDTFEFGTRKLNDEGEIDYRAYKLRPLRIIRRGRVPLGEQVDTIFRLQERTEDATVTDSGAITLAGQPLSIAPKDLYQNLHYAIRGGTATGVGLRRDADVPNRFRSDRFDFALSRVEPGDTLRMDGGPARGSYTVIARTEDGVFVTPAAPADFYGQHFVVQARPARSDSRVITFYEGAVPAHVTRYWAEAAIVRNDAAVEAQFGHLVGLRLDEWAARGLTNSYKDAVSGLMFARMFAPTIAGMTNAVSLLAGIPFAHERSVVDSIINDYEIDERTGAPLITRVTLTSEDDAQSALPSIISAHTFPAFQESTRDPEFSGIARGADGLPLKIGSVIEQYTALALGVKIMDIYTGGAADLSDVKDRHRFRVVIDVDSANINTSSLRLIYDFVVEVKPAYTAFLLRLRKFLVDYIVIEEDVHFRLKTTLYDNPHHTWPQANIFDPPIPQPQDVQQNPLTTWYPEDGVITVDPGDDTALLLDSALGGFMDPRGVGGFVDISDENWPQPWISAGDVVRMRDTSAAHEVLDVISDTQLRIRKSDSETDNTSRTDVAFVVRRPSGDPLFNAQVDDVSNDERIGFSLLGYVGNSIGVGDYITFETATDASTLLQVTHDQTLIDGRRMLSTFPAKPASISGPCTIRVFHERTALRRAALPEQGIQLTLAGAGIYRADTNLAVLGIEPGQRVMINGSTSATIVFVARNLISFYDHTPQSASEIITMTLAELGADAESFDIEEIGVESCAVLRVKNVLVWLSRSSNFVVVQTSDPLQLKSGDMLVLPEGHGLTLYGQDEGPDVVRVGGVLDQGHVLPAKLVSGSTLALQVTLLRQPANQSRTLIAAPARDRVQYGQWATIYRRDI
jgi:hypothetical protein